MWESLIVAALIMVLAMAGWAHKVIPWVDLLRYGAVLIVVGVAVSVAGGIVYHATLYRALQPRGLLPRRWWIEPTGLNKLLTPEQRPQVIPWFVVGAFGFLVVMLGCATVLLSVWNT